MAISERATSNPSKAKSNLPKRVDALYLLVAVIVVLVSGFSLTQWMVDLQYDQFREDLRTEIMRISGLVNNNAENKEEVMSTTRWLLHQPPMLSLYYFSSDEVILTGAQASLPAPYDKLNNVTADTVAGATRGLASGVDILPLFGGDVWVVYTLQIKGKTQVLAAQFGLQTHHRELFMTKVVGFAVTGVVVVLVFVIFGLQDRRRKLIGVTSKLTSQLELQSQAEDNVRNDGALFQTVFRASGLPMIMINQQGQVTSGNPYFWQLTGTDSRDSLQYPSLIEYMDPHDAGRLIDVLEKLALQTKEAGFYEEVYELVINGQMRPMHVRVLQIVGMPTFVVSLYDQTDEQAVKRLESLSAVLKMLTEKSQEAMLLTDRFGQITWANDAMCQLTGHDHASLVGQNPDDVLSSEMGDGEAIQVIQQRIKEQEAGSVTIMQSRADGSSFWCDLRLYPFKDTEGQLTHWLRYYQPDQ